MENSKVKQHQRNIKLPHEGGVSCLLYPDTIRGNRSNRLSVLLCSVVVLKVMIQQLSVFRDDGVQSVHMFFLHLDRVVLAASRLHAKLC